MAVRKDEIWDCLLDPEVRQKDSATAVTSALLERIRQWDPEIRAFISVTADEALADAGRVDTAREAGERLPLDGLPIAVKDCIDVAGVPTTVGSEFFRGAVASTDSEVVRRLRHAGAVVLGKTNLHEFVFGGTTDNPFYGTCKNPWDLSRIPGGSSGGSGAALAAGLCAGALGSDTGGSVRVPAALNGVAGLRPTYGNVSARGVFPLSRTFDAVGPMARRVRDVAAMFEVIRGYDELDARAVRPPGESAADGADAQGLAGVRLGIATGFFFDGVDAEVADRTRAAIDILANLAGGIEEIATPGAEDASRWSNPIIWSEAFAVHRERYEQEPGRFGADTRARLEMGAAVTGPDFADALQGMYEWQRSVARLFSRVDVILTPTTMGPAPRLVDVETVSVTAGLVRLNHQWSLSHTPSLVVPCGFTDDGLPIGLQMAAARWNDSLLLRVGAAFQDVTDWHLRRPPELPLPSAGTPAAAKQHEGPRRAHSGVLETD